MRTSETRSGSAKANIPGAFGTGFGRGGRWRETASPAAISRIHERPISAVFVGLTVLLIALQIYVRIRGAKAPIEIPTVLEDAE